MRTTPPLFFYLLLCCQTTESLTLKPVILGGNVTLDCDLDIKDIYWFFMKLPESLVMIFRTFTSESKNPAFSDQRLKNKYSSKILSRLFISNITEDELGIYYCLKTVTDQKLNNGTKLYITETAHQNKTEDKLQNTQHNTTHSVLTCTSISLNVLLFITLIVLLMPRCRKPRQSPKPHQVEAQQLEDLNTAEYSEIELPTCSRGAQPSQINGIYALLEKPKPDARRTKT